jgi:predicted short-subunit dehydrogenase-like oxidoreductase (DUF2520 family)
VTAWVRDPETEPGVSCQRIGRIVNTTTLDPVGIIGSGAVAQALGRVLYDRGVPIVALAARDSRRAAGAAAFIGLSVRSVTVKEIARLAAHLIIAVSDEAIGRVARELADAGMHDGIVVHTCGARGPQALAPLDSAGLACGVLHPLQTVPSPDLGIERLLHVTFGVGGDPRAVAWADRIVSVLEGRVLLVAAGGFPAYHAAATLAGNSVAAFVDAALLLMGRAGVEAQAALEALAPLCRASVENVLAIGPTAALTGPIARGDATTVRAHLEALADAPEGVAELYCAAGRRLLEIARRRHLDEEASLRIAGLLNSVQSKAGD